MSEQDPFTFRHRATVGRLAFSPRPAVRASRRLAALFRSLLSSRSSSAIFRSLRLRLSMRLARSIIVRRFGSFGISRLSILEAEMRGLQACEPHASRSCSHGATTEAGNREKVVGMAGFEPTPPDPSPFSATLLRFSTDGMSLRSACHARDPTTIRFSTAFTKWQAAPRFCYHCVTREMAVKGSDRHRWPAQSF
jgi:hypothetical protein